MTRLLASASIWWDLVQASARKLWGPTIHLDFETRGRAEDAEFICGAYQIGDGPVVTFTRPEDAPHFPLDYRGEL